MHLPDHYLSTEVCIVSAAAAAGIVGLSGAFRRPNFDRLPRPTTLAMAAATVFAAQMVNFPVASGTSGHLLGAAAVAILLGLWPAVLTMAVVVTVQCLLFADGGVAALGANLLNMAIVAPVGAAAVYAFASHPDSGRVRRLVAAAFSAWVSVVAASAACSMELAASGAESLPETLAAMVPIHAIIGVSEALITVAVVALVGRYSNIETKVQSRLGFAVAIAVVMLLAPLASSLPDGLESVASQLHFQEDAAQVFAPIMPDYSIQGIDSEVLTTIVAGLIGIVVCTGLAWSLRRCLYPRHADSRS